MASGLFLRLKAQNIPLKMYGFETVDRERERAIVQRLSGVPAARRARPASAGPAVAATAAAADASADQQQVCEKYRTALNSPEPPDPDDDHEVLPEEYSKTLYGRLGRAHTFSSRCKQRNLDPHWMCSGKPGEAPDLRPIRDINEEAMRPPTPPEKKKQQQLQQQLQQQRRPRPSLAAIAGFGAIITRNLDTHRSAERHQEAAKQKASPFGLVFRVGDVGAGTAERPVASAAVFGALGRLRYRAKKEKLEQRERDERARHLCSDWEIVNATEFVRNYERENRRAMRLAVLARPTVSSQFKTAVSALGGCPFCRELPELAAGWQQRLTPAGDGAEGEAAAECPRCGRSHDAWRRQSRPSTAAETGVAADGEAAASAASAAAAAAEGNQLSAEAQAVLVARLQAPTRASEGGVPFCQRGRRAVGPGLGDALLGFEGQRPKSAIERVSSVNKRKELIDAMSSRLHSGCGGGGSSGHRQ